MLLIRRALWFFFLKLFISFCLNLSFLFLRGPHYWLLNFPLTSNSWSSNSTSASAGVPSPTIPRSPLSETMAGEPCKLVQPYSSHQPTTHADWGQNQRERPLKYNHVHNEGTLKNNKHIHQRRVGVQKREGEKWGNVSLQVFLKSEQHRVGEKKTPQSYCTLGEGAKGHSQWWW